MYTYSYTRPIHAYRCSAISSNKSVRRFCARLQANWASNTCRVASFSQKKIWNCSDRAEGLLQDAKRPSLRLCMHSFRVSKTCRVASFKQKKSSFVLKARSC